MNGLWSDITKFWLVFWGRRKTALRYSFRENEIASTGFVMNVSPLWGAYYLNLHPTHFAVAIAPDGGIMNLRGGFTTLAPGRYILHYVDKQNRVTLIPRTTETTLDGPQVSLELVVTYRVMDPIKALEVQQAVDTLVVFIQSDVKEFIRSHRYEEIVGDANGNKIDNEPLVRFIKDQHTTRHQMFRLFFIADIVIEDKLGDPKVSEMREKIQINQRQYDVDSEIQRQNQELGEKVAAQEAAIRKIRAESEAKQQDILQQMRLKQIELDNAKQEFQARQVILERAVDAIGQGLSAQAYPQDPQVVKAMRDLLGAVVASPNRIQEAATKTGDLPPDRENGASSLEDIDSLTNNLLQLIKRKRF